MWCQKLFQTLHSIWNHGPQLENLMITVVPHIPKLQAILSHNYEDTLIKTWKLIWIFQLKLHVSDSVSEFQLLMLPVNGPMKVMFFYRTEHHFVGFDRKSDANRTVWFLLKVYIYYCYSFHVVYGRVNNVFSFLGEVVPPCYHTLVVEICPAIYSCFLFVHCR